MKGFVMEIIAQTVDGVIISATTKEVKKILRSVTGDSVEKLNIGQKIPAIDYAASITKVKDLNDNYEFTQLRSRVKSFTKEFEKLEGSIEQASLIDV